MNRKKFKDITEQCLIISICRASIHKVVSKQSSRSVKSSQPVSKQTVFEKLNKLKRFLRASGIKVNVNELLKGNELLFSVEISIFFCEHLINMTFR